MQPTSERHPAFEHNPPDLNQSEILDHRRSLPSFTIILQDKIETPPEPQQLVALLRENGMPVEFDPSQKELGRESPMYARVVQVIVGGVPMVMKFIGGAMFDMEDPAMQAIGVEASRDYLRLDLIAFQAGRDGLQEIPPLMGSIVEAAEMHDPKNGFPRPVAVFAPFVDGLELDKAYQTGILTLDEAREKLVALFTKLGEAKLVRWDPEPDNFFHILPNGDLMLIDGGSVRPEDELSDEHRAVLQNTSGGLLSPEQHAERVMTGLIGEEVGHA